MKLGAAIELIRPAVPAPPAGATWADLGAGKGTFTRALARLLGPEARIIAIDRDREAVEILRARARVRDEADAAILPVHGDFRDPQTIGEFADVELDGALLANSLHYLDDADLVLIRIAGAVRPGGRIIVVEYDRRPASRWVPYPVPIDRLRDLAARAGLSPPVILGQRPSAYGGVMYCAYATRPQ